MITITIPEWFTWLLIVLMALQLVSTVAGVILEHLHRKIAKGSRDE